MTTLTKTKTKFTYAEEVAFEKIWQDAKDASFAALHKGGFTLFPCGYGNLRLPKRGKFAKWLLENDLASDNYGSGISLSTYPHMGFATGAQSYDANNAIADAIAEVLTAAGYTPSINRWID